MSTTAPSSAADQQAASTASAASTSLTPEQRQLYETLSEQLRADGTRDELKRYLKDRLLDAKWTAELTRHCQQVIYERGLKNVTVDQLIQSTSEKAKGSVPNEVQEGMIEYIRETLINRAQ